MINVHILLGGIWGPDGYATSAGMNELTRMLRAFPDTVVTMWTWDQWEKAGDTLLKLPDRAPRVLIGYSGGGSRATWLVNDIDVAIDLLVAYDPSPKWQMKPLPANVLSAVCYHNEKPMMWFPGIGSLGGGQLANGPMRKEAIITYEIAEQHLAVQFDQALHARTVQAVRKLAGE